MKKKNDDLFSLSNEDFEKKEKEKEDYFLDDDLEVKKEDDKITKIKKPKRNFRFNKFILFIFLDIIWCVMFYLVGLFWQNKFTLMAHTNASWVAFALRLVFAWGIWMYQFNIFTPLLHGLKTFFLMFVGKKPKHDYYTVSQRIKNSKLPKKYVILSFSTTGTLLILAITLTIIWYQGYTPKEIPILNF